MVGFLVIMFGFMDVFDIVVYIWVCWLEIKIVFGNVYVFLFGVLIFEYFLEIDYLVIGEGEGVMFELVDGKLLNEIGNLIYCEEIGKI